jgi:streptomycin 6-kinase
MIDIYLSGWDLIPEGNPIVTNSSRLLPVRYRGKPAMLKLATEEEERLGGVLMEWWDGDGAARVLARDDNALLLERAEGTASLAEMHALGATMRLVESCAPWRPGCTLPGRSRRRRN